MTSKIRGLKFVQIAPKLVTKSLLTLIFKQELVQIIPKLVTNLIFRAKEICNLVVRSVQAERVAILFSVPWVRHIAPKASGNNHHHRSILLPLNQGLIWHIYRLGGSEKRPQRADEFGQGNRGGTQSYFRRR